MKVTRPTSQREPRQESARPPPKSRLCRFGGAQAYEWDLASNNVLAPPGFATLFGLLPDQPITSNDLIARIHPEDRSQLEAAYQHALWCKGPYEQEFRVVLPDGSVRWLLSLGEVVCDDGDQPAAFVGIALDITHRKQAEIAAERREAELIEYQQRVRLMADTMPQMVWTARPDGYPDYFNLRWYEFTGVPEGTPVGDEWRDLFHPDDLDRLATRWYHSVATGETYEIEYRLRHKSGEYRWMLCRALPVRNQQGKIERWFGTFTDIHDLKTTQRALAESEEFTSRLLSSLNDCVAVLDLDGHLRFMNEGGQRAMEVGDFKWIDGSLWLNFWTDPTAPVRTAIERAGAGGTSQFESFFPTLAGTNKWWDVLVTPMKGPDGRPQRILWISRDVTERKRAEDSIAEMAQRYRLAARATNDATWDWDLTTDHHVWNEDVQWLFGYAPEEVGPIQWWEERIHPEDRERVLRGLHTVIDGPDSHWSAEYRFREADGSYAIVFDRGYVLRDDKGRALRMTGVMLDITERKRVEDQQALVNRELHHRVKNTLATVQALISATARRAQTITEFQQAVTDRIISLAKTHTLLIENPLDWAALRDIMASELEVYDDGTGQRVSLNGPDVLLPSAIAVVFGMALHELATNAAKHGALSLPTGHLDVWWSLKQQSDGRKLAVHWCERGGPAVTKPKEKGFGSMLLQSLARQLSGEIDIIFAPTGLEVRLSATLPPVRNGS